jgi:hypothetical protein
MVLRILQTADVAHPAGRVPFNPPKVEFLDFIRLPMFILK